MAIKFDVLWYHIVTSKGHEWREVLCTPAEFAQKQAQLARAGYVSVLGRRSIGAPEGAPRR